MSHSTTGPADPDPGGPVLFYDGECGLCHGAVRFLMRRHGRHDFRFAPLQGESFRELVPAEQAAALPDSLVVRAADGSLAVRSDAMVAILLGLDGGWARLGRILRPLPRWLRDLPYRLVAKVRGLLFRKPEGLCPIPPPEQRDRFLP